MEPAKLPPDWLARQIASTFEEVSHWPAWLRGDKDAHETGTEPEQKRNETGTKAAYDKIGKLLDRMNEVANRIQRGERGEPLLPVNMYPAAP